MRGRVLVLGDDDRSFLSVIRSLGRKGIEVHTGWCPSDSPALASRYITEAHHIRPFSSESGSWKNDLLGILESWPFDLVIPCTDQTIIPLRSASDELRRLARFYLLPGDTYEIVSNKVQTIALASSLGVPVPEEIEIENKEEAVRAAESLGFPVILKPVSSFSAVDVATKNKVRTAHDLDELADFVETMLLRGRFVVQKFLPGHGTGIEIIADSGRILFAFQHERIHEPLKGGGSSYRRSIPLDDDMLDATRRIVSALDYKGVAMFEFRHDNASGDWRLLEINGRFWGSLPLALASGADFPWYLYQMLVEDRREFPQEYKTGIYCRNLASDLHWNLSNAGSNRSDTTLNTLPLRSVISEVKNVVSLRERSDTFVLDDMMPALVQTAQLAGTALKRLFRRAKKSGIPEIAESSMKMREIISRSERIHFVCKGNICRSPFAEYYARSIFPGRIITGSSGYYESTGRESPPEAVQAAGELGIDISGHRSTVIDDAIVRQQDVIFVFDERIYSKISKMFPETQSKIFRIGSLLHPPSNTISDPYGKDLGEFRRIYRLIVEAVDRIAEMTKPGQGP